jgi:hypothetical protein
MIRLAERIAKRQQRERDLRCEGSDRQTRRVLTTPIRVATARVKSKPPTATISLLVCISALVWFSPPERKNRASPTPAFSATKAITEEIPRVRTLSSIGSKEERR